MVQPIGDTQHLVPQEIEPPAEVEAFEGYLGQDERGLMPQPAPARPGGALEHPHRRVALVTAGTAGLGLAAALELARRGWNLFLQYSGATSAALEAENAVHSAAALAGFETTQALSHIADLRDPASREQLVEAALEAFERIDLLVNALPVPPGGVDLLELDEIVYRRVLDETLTATLFLTQQAAREMVRLTEGGRIEKARIVTLTSTNAAVSSIDYPAQCISQAGLAMMTRLLADRLGRYGISVYEVRYGILASGYDEPAHQRYDNLIAQGLTPLRRWGRPADVARATAAIAEGLLDFSTGDVIHVDGGLHVQRL